MLPGLWPVRDNAILCGQQPVAVLCKRVDRVGTLAFQSDVKWGSNFAGLCQRHPFLGAACTVFVSQSARYTGCNGPQTFTADDL
jgi:hypothetical protein